MTKLFSLKIASINPVLDRELRQRSRSSRSMVVLTLFLGALIGVAYLSFLAASETSQYSSNPLAHLTQTVGRTVFETVLLVELLILMLIIPAFSAGAVTSERDRQTLIPLQVTLVGPIGIFMGKVAASAGFVLLMMIASAPVLAVPFILGGLSLSTIVASLAALLLIGVLLASIGVACSCIFRKTQTATLAAYASVLALVLGSLFATAALALIDSSRGTDRIEIRPWPLYFNPILAVADVAGGTEGRTVGPLGGASEAFLTARLEGGPDVVFQNGQAFNRRTGQVIDAEDSWQWLPVWARSLGAITMFALVLSTWAVRRLKAPYREIPS